MSHFSTRHYRWRGAARSPRETWPRGNGRDSPLRNRMRFSLPPRRLTATTSATVRIAVLSTAGIACWAILYPWYSLPAHYADQCFGFDKVPDHFHSPVLRSTH